MLQRSFLGKVKTTVREAKFPHSWMGYRQDSGQSGQEHTGGHLGSSLAAPPWPSGASERISGPSARGKVQHVPSQAVPHSRGGDPFSTHMKPSLIGLAAAIVIAIAEKLYRASVNLFAKSYEDYGKTQYFC